MNDHLNDYTDEERARFSSLPRTEPLDAQLEERVVSGLREAGVLSRPRSRWFPIASVALAAGLIGVAWIAGVRHGAELARRGSIEGMLSRQDLPPAERVLLMQRAGSAYVEAAHSYASSVARIDTAAVEVSSQVLIGAAQAVARTGLDNGMSPRLSSLLTDLRRPGKLTNTVIWY
jgi:hypothetical protein